MNSMASLGISQNAKLESKNIAQMEPTQKNETDRSRLRQKIWASWMASSRKDKAKKPKSATRNPMKNTPKPGPKACWLANNKMVPPRARLVYRPPRVRRSKLYIPITRIRKCPTGTQSPFKMANVSDRIQKEAPITAEAMSNGRTRD